jgi:hypothetical protein
MISHVELTACEVRLLKKAIARLDGSDELVLKNVAMILENASVVAILCQTTDLPKKETPVTSTKDVS